MDTLWAAVDAILVLLLWALLALILFAAFGLPLMIGWHTHQDRKHHTEPRIDPTLPRSNRPTQELMRERELPGGRGNDMGAVVPESAARQPKVGPHANCDSPTESPAEQSLWEAYLDSPETRRVIELIPQYQVGRYRVDFADPRLCIAVEVDGLAYHNGQDSFVKDQQRQRDLQSLGWRVIRFAAKETLDSPVRCLAEIRRSTASRW